MSNSLLCSLFCSAAKHYDHCVNCGADSKQIPPLGNIGAANLWLNEEEIKLVEQGEWLLLRDKVLFFQVIFCQLRCLEKLF